MYWFTPRFFFLQLNSKNLEYNLKYLYLEIYFVNIVQNAFVTGGMDSIINVFTLPSFDGKSECNVRKNILFGKLEL